MSQSVGSYQFKHKSEPYVCVIGCANIDIAGFPNDKLILKDSNQGNLQISMGGVGRNIAENLARLGVNVKLITVIGDDAFSDLIKGHSAELNIGLEQCMYLENQNSALHMAVMNEENDLAVAVSAMSIYDLMEVSFVKSKLEFISSAMVAILDTSMPQDVIEYILSNVKDQKFFIEVDAAVKAKRILNVLKHIFFLKLNVIELEMLTNSKLENDEDLVKAVDQLHFKGVNNICISLGERGLFYSNNDNTEFVKAPAVNVVNTNGAGDALAAGIVYGYINKTSFRKAITFGQACAAITIQHKDTVSVTLTKERMVTLADTL